MNWGSRNFYMLIRAAAYSMSMCTLRGYRNWAILSVERLQTFSDTTRQGAEEAIKKCHQKHKRHIKRISLSLWHLSEADFNLNVDRSEHEQVFGKWYKKGSGTIKESAAYLFGTLLPPTRVAAGV